MRSIRKVAEEDSLREYARRELLYLVVSIIVSSPQTVFSLVYLFVFALVFKRFRIPSSP